MKKQMKFQKKSGTDAMSVEVSLRADADVSLILAVAENYYTPKIQSNGLPASIAGIDTAAALEQLAKRIERASNVAYEVFEQGMKPNHWRKNSFERHVAELCAVLQKRYDSCSPRLAKLL